MKEKRWTNKDSKQTDERKNRMNSKTHINEKIDEWHNTHMNEKKTDEYKNTTPHRYERKNRWTKNKIAKKKKQ